MDVRIPRPVVCMEVVLQDAGVICCKVSAHVAPGVAPI